MRLRGWDLPHDRHSSIFTSGGYAFCSENVPRYQYDGALHYFLTLWRSSLTLLIVEVSRPHNTVGRTPFDVWLRPYAETSTWKHTWDRHSLVGIVTHNLGKPAAVNTGVRQLGHGDRRHVLTAFIKAVVRSACFRCVLDYIAVVSVFSLPRPSRRDQKVFGAFALLCTVVVAVYCCLYDLCFDLLNVILEWNIYFQFNCWPTVPDHVFHACVPPTELT